jgi:hypothetical protein
MSLLRKMFGRSEEPKTRVRVCIECGMPLDQHKPWCAIDQMRREGDKPAAGSDERASR